jgi:hypothetical protein
LPSPCDAPDNPADERIDDDIKKNRDAVNEKNYFRWFTALQNEQIKGTRPKNDCEYVERPSVKRVMIRQIEPDHQQDDGDDKTDTAEGEQEFAFHWIFSLNNQSPSR